MQTFTEHARALAILYLLGISREDVHAPMPRIPALPDDGRILRPAED